MAMRVTYLVLDGEIISENRNGVERDYLPDPQGNTVALLDNTQTKPDTFTYWPYGELVNRTGATPTPFQYGGSWGYYTDSGRNVYIGMPYYNNGNSRWSSQTILRNNNGAVNTYLYALSSPTDKLYRSGTLELISSAIQPTIGLNGIISPPNGCACLNQFDCNNLPKGCKADKYFGGAFYKCCMGIGGCCQSDGEYRKVLGPSTCPRGCFPGAAQHGPTPKTVCQSDGMFPGRCRPPIKVPKLPTESANLSVERLSPCPRNTD